jgi:hypothetical protein
MAKTKIERDDLMERTAAAVCYLNAVAFPDSEQGRRLEAFAFLSVVHPEISLKKRLKMAADIAKKN